MKILVIGSSGFIGSHLINYFKSKGHEIFGADIKPSSTGIKTDYILPPDFHDFIELFKKIKFDVCVNASGSASVAFSISNPGEDFRLNVANVNLILHAIRSENPACNFINFSSAAVYGNPSSLPVKEDMKLSPVSPYGFHKMISEQICTEFRNLYQIKTCSLRVFSAYGPGLQKQLFWDIHQKMKISKKIELFGTGNESRDFIFIEDLCFAIDCIIRKAPFTGESINVAAGQEIYIKNAVEHFINEYNPVVKYSFSGQEKKGDPLNWKADISLLQQCGFIPKTTFKDGIRKLVEWLKNEN